MRGNPLPVIGEKEPPAGSSPAVVRVIRRVLRRLLIAGFILLSLTVLYLGSRVLFYRQTDDRQHLALKGEYLGHVAEMSERALGGPNLVIILFDDLGPGDIGAYGGSAIATPNLDRLAGEGLLFRNAYAPSPYCSASRAGLLTGRYAVRAGLDHVLQAPGSWEDVLERLGGLNRRLPAEEITLAEVLQAAGYATAAVGKWHLGDASPSLPNDMGFDNFFGLLFSNDQGKPVVWRDREIVEQHPIDQETLTRRYTERAVAFLDDHGNRPFFLYLPHTYPHIPVFMEMWWKSSIGARGRFSRLWSETAWRKTRWSSLRAITGRGSKEAPAGFVAASSMSLREGCGCRSSPGGPRGSPPAGRTRR
jgi:hypothetical protein